ncbi:MAG: cytochrome C [Alphaproteobacteria bacterium]
MVLLIIGAMAGPVAADEPPPPPPPAPPVTGVRVAGPLPRPVCGNCHAWRQPVLERRTLKAPHDKIALAHGGQPFWCLDCHVGSDPSTLRTFGGDAVAAFGEADRLCVQCHGRQVRDWRAGVHGRRVGGWQGERTVLRCAACHDPHRPAWTPTPPSPPPPARRARIEGE